MIEFFKENDRFSKYCGAELVSCEPGHAEIRLKLTKKHLNFIGRPHVHAGVLYTLAESASAAAILPYGWDCCAVEGVITYVDSVDKGVVTAVAKGKDEHDRESGSCRVRLFNEKGDIIAKAKFTILYTGERFAFPEEA
jgi:uncharacterized protein (TIGR00369 family)